MAVDHPGRRARVTPPCREVPTDSATTRVVPGPCEGGSMHLLLLADTHVPKRARDLPETVWREVDRADVVVHAGDWVDVSLLDALRARSRRLVGVAGNNDHGVLRERLPEVARVELEGLRLGVVHETGG